MPEGATVGVTAGGAIGGTIGLLALVPWPSPAWDHHCGGPHHSGVKRRSHWRGRGWAHRSSDRIGHNEYEAKGYEGKVKEGGILISVHSENNEETSSAKAIFEKRGCS